MLDSIAWLHSSPGVYTSSLIYQLQFAGSTFSPINTLVWYAWAPLKYKLFAWMLIQNRVWLVDRLQRFGLPNCGCAPLCRPAQESGTHLLFHCRFSVHTWDAVSRWLGTPYFSTGALDLLAPGLGLFDRLDSPSRASKKANKKANASMIILSLGSYGTSTTLGSFGTSPTFLA